MPSSAMILMETRRWIGRKIYLHGSSADSWMDLVRGWAELVRDAVMYPHSTIKIIILIQDLLL